MTDALVTYTDPTPPRRRFLQLLALSAAAAGTVAASGEAHARGRKKEFRGVLVFRLSTRKHQSCKACKSHHKFKVFLTHALADRTRAHRAWPWTADKLPRHVHYQSRSLIKFLRLSAQRRAL